MVEDVTARDRALTGFLAIHTGVLMITLVPHAMIAAMDAVLTGIAVKLPTIPNPDVKAAPQIVTLFFLLWVR